jgi:hypothetical protein
MSKEDVEQAPEAEQQERNEKKPRTSIKYPPYVNGYGAIGKLFEEISKASVPPKFNQDFMESVLQMKSSSHRALIPLLKRLHFIDASNVPTDSYKQFRDESQRGSVMARQLRLAYSDLYRAHEYAHTLKKEELKSKLRGITGAAEDDPNLSFVASTFLELVKLADFEGVAETHTRDPRSEDDARQSRLDSARREPASRSLGLSYTINLNLPATTEIEVFNAIFKSLKEHILDD